MNRREFLFSSGALAAAFATAKLPARGEDALSRPKADSDSGSLLASEPMLQNAADTSIGVVFAVNAEAGGWVDYSERPDLRDARRVYSGSGGLVELNDRFARVRLTGLRPATRYYYRVGADRIDYQDGYSIRNLGSEVSKTVHHFTTIGAEAGGCFCVINDTHESASVLKRCFAKLHELSPSLVIWNGDASHCLETVDSAVDVFLRPHPDFLAYAADTPYMFLPGNHDYRGRFNRHLGDLVMFREPTERRPEFASLGRNFVQRFGDVALIGLDTGESKRDASPDQAGIFRMTDYRRLQTEWLADALKSEPVTSARFRVAICHIPLFIYGQTERNGGRASGYAHLVRSGADSWVQMLGDAGVKLVISGHKHRFRYTEPGLTRKWGQLVGGGPDLDASDNPNRFPTVIAGRVDGDRLNIEVHDLRHGKVVKRLGFSSCKLPNA